MEFPFWVTSCKLSSLLSLAEIPSFVEMDLLRLFDCVALPN